MRTFTKLHPAVQLVYFLSIIIVAMFDQNPILLLISMASGIAICFRLQNTQALLKDLLFYAVIFIIITLSNPFFSQNGNTPLIFINDLPITLESLVYGMFIAITLISVISWFKIFSINMTGDKFMYLFGRYFPNFALTISMIFKFIPQFKKQAENTRRIQQTLGLYSNQSLKHRLNSSVKIFSIVLTWSLENALDTAASMKARGYGFKERSNYSIYRFTVSDYITLSFVLSLDLVVFFGIALGSTRFSFYPTVGQLNVSGLALAAYLCFGILALLPFYMDFKENLKWKYYISKI